MQFHKIILPCVFLFSAVQADAQEISGAWQGHYEKGRKNELKMDIELYNDSLIKGIRTQYYGNGEYESFSISGLFNRKDSVVTIAEDSALSQNADGFGDRGTYTMKLSIEGATMKLKGKWKNSGQSWFTSMSSKVVLEKEGEMTTTAKKRTPSVIHTMHISKADADSVKIEVWDYERIDNDIISLYLNDSLVLDKWKLTGQPKSIYLSLGTSPQEYVISMVAESQGIIPPCTADILIVSRNNTGIFKLRSNTGREEGIAIKID
jgi:hypothetical protein